MDRHIFPSSIKKIRLCEIDIGDRRFCFRYRLLWHTLTDSIKRVGILSPPLLREKSGGYQIISGFRRIFAAAPFFDALNCIIYPKELSDEECIRILIAEHKENLLHPLDYAGLLQLASKTLNEEEICTTFSIDRKRLKLLCKVFENPILSQLLWKQKLKMERAFLFLGMEKDVAENILSLYEMGLSPSFSHLKELATFLTQLKRIFGSLNKVFTDPLIKEALKKEDGKQKLEALLQALFKMRYPFLSSYTKRVKEEIKSMKGIKIHIDPFFEKKNLKIELEVENEEDLKEKIEICKKYMDEGRFASIFKLLQGKEEIEGF